MRVDDYLLYDWILPFVAIIIGAPAIAAVIYIFMYGWCDLVPEWCD
jgi:hypothetical protein